MEAESFLLFGLFGFLESLPLVSLVVPLLSDGPVHLGLLDAVQKGTSHRLDSSDESCLGIDNS